VYFRYKPQDYYERNHELKKALDQIRDNHFSPREHGVFQDIYNSMLYHDRWGDGLVYPQYFLFSQTSTHISIYISLEKPQILSILDNLYSNTLENRRFYSLQFYDLDSGCKR
jgi:glucan phosphorylase